MIGGRVPPADGSDRCRSAAVWNRAGTTRRSRRDAVRSGRTDVSHDRYDGGGARARREATGGRHRRGRPRTGARCRGDGRRVTRVFARETSGQRPAAAATRGDRSATARPPRWRVRIHEVSRAAAGW